ncbi:MAG TPA: thioredoxin-dependent thiol peroxidase [Gammaproteobacteria bacterium]|nr:thioredoxin-dependent thiol peroxidase [Gammaproteobacteria bacterium]
MTLNVGDKAPPFNLVSDQDQSVSLDSLCGKKIILYFYPKNNTPGCTREACDFRDNIHQFENRGAIVLGISKDNPASHRKFKEKYHLPFPLLFDETGEVCQAYGVINKKSLFGNTFLGINRSTFLIDEQGILRAIWRKVKVVGHSEAVFNALNKSGSEA